MQPIALLGNTCFCLLYAYPVFKSHETDTLLSQKQKVQINRYYSQTWDDCRLRHGLGFQTTVSEGSVDELLFVENHVEINHKKSAQEPYSVFRKPVCDRAQVSLSSPGQARVPGAGASLLQAFGE